MDNTTDSLKKPLVPTPKIQKNFPKKRTASTPTFYATTKERMNEPINKDYTLPTSYLIHLGILYIYNIGCSSLVVKKDVVDTVFQHSFSWEVI